MMQPFNKFRQEYGLPHAQETLNYMEVLDDGQPTSYWDPNTSQWLPYSTGYTYTSGNMIMATKENTREKVELAGGFVAYLSVNEVNAFMKYVANKKIHINFHLADQERKVAIQSNNHVYIREALIIYEKAKAAMFRLSEQWVKKHGNPNTPVDINSYPITNWQTGSIPLGSPRVYC